MVFAMEKLSAEGKHFHKSCFKVNLFAAFHLNQLLSRDAHAMRDTVFNSMDRGALA